MSKEKYGFVYIWRDRKHNRYYIGCHWGTENDGYICSSDWMRRSFNRRPKDFKRRILKTDLTRNQMYLEEQRVFDMIKTHEIKNRYYNLNLTSIKLWHSYPDRNLSVGQKISKSKKGKPTGPCSPEKAEKISKAKLGVSTKRSEEGLEKFRESMAGRQLSEQHKSDISSGLLKHFEANPGNTKGLSRSEESKISTSKKLKGTVRYMDEFGNYVGRFIKTNPIIKEQNLVPQITPAQQNQIKERSFKAAKSNTGKKAYNNGIIEKKFGPSEIIPFEFKLGGLPRKRSLNN
jgi:hypothetical protein